MQSIEFTIKGTRPVLFSKEPIAFEERPAKGNGRKSKDETPQEQAAKCLHTIENGKGPVAVIPSHSILKGLQAVTTIALGRSTRKSYVKLVKGAVQIEPANLVISPQDWTLDVRRAGSPMKGSGTGALLYRPRFDLWEVKGSVIYDDEHLSAEQIRALFDTAGKFNGVGSYRIGNGGPMGSYMVNSWVDEE